MKTLEQSVPTHIRIPVSLMARLDKAAKKLNTTKAELIRHLLKQGVVKL